MKYDIKKCIITLFSKVVEVTAGALRWVVSENEWNSGKSHEKNICALIGLLCCFHIHAHSASTSLNE